MTQIIDTDNKTVDTKWHRQWNRWQNDTDNKIVDTKDDTNIDTDDYIY